MEGSKKDSNNNSQNDNLIFKYAINKLVTLMSEYKFDSMNCNGTGPFYMDGIIKEVKDGFILFKPYSCLDVYIPRELRDEDEYYLININKIISIKLKNNPYNNK